MIFNKYIGDLESTTKTRFIQRVWELLTKEFQAVCSHEPLPLAEYQKEISEMFDQTDVIPIQVPLLKKVVTYAKEFVGNSRKICWQQNGSMRSFWITCWTTACSSSICSAPIWCTAIS